SQRRGDSSDRRLAAGACRLGAAKARVVILGVGKAITPLQEREALAMHRNGPSYRMIICTFGVRIAVLDGRPQPFPDRLFRLYEECPRPIWNSYARSRILKVRSAIFLEETRHGDVNAVRDCDHQAAQA